MSDKGVAWIEMFMDFVIATRVTLTGKNVTKTRAVMSIGDPVTHCAYNFASALRRLLHICNGEKLPLATFIPTLVPLGGRPVAGLPRRPRMLGPIAGFREFATQALN